MNNQPETDTHYQSMSGQAPCNNRPLAPDDKTTDIPDFITCGGCRIWLIRQAVLSVTA